jgi:hypothetical protein
VSLWYLSECRIILLYLFALNVVKLSHNSPFCKGGGRGGFIVTVLKSPFAKGGLEGRIFNLTTLYSHLLQANWITEDVLRLAQKTKCDLSLKAFEGQVAFFVSLEVDCKEIINRQSSALSS